MSTTVKNELERSWLVQRLEKPRGGPPNPFSFGGGLRNGGLSDEAMGLLRGVFSFDYMGAAEFEFGAVPEALQRIASSADSLTAFSISIPLSEVAPDWRDDRPAPDGDGTVYVLCPAEWATDVEARIREWAGEDFNRNLKESTRLRCALRPHSEWDGDVCGWLELNNGFLFFTDREMWEATAGLFGTSVPSSRERP